MHVLQNDAMLFRTARLKQNAPTVGPPSTSGGLTCVRYSEANIARTDTCDTCICSVSSQLQV